MKKKIKTTAILGVLVCLSFWSRTEAQNACAPVQDSIGSESVMPQNNAFVKGLQAASGSITGMVLKLVGSGFMYVGEIFNSVGKELVILEDQGKVSMHAADNDKSANRVNYQ